MMNSESRSSPNSTTTINIVSLHDALQTGPNSTYPETTSNHDSHTTSGKQELSKSSTIPKLFEIKNVTV